MRGTDLATILQAVGSGLAIIITIITAIVKVKQAKTTTEKVRLLNKYAQIVQQIPTLVTEAEEKVGSGNGALKKTIVLQQIQLQCAKMNLDYNEQNWETEIEKVLTTPQKKEAEKCTTNVNNNSSTQSMQISQNAEMMETNNN